MRISDWSSDVCSSDLRCCGERNPPCPQNTCRNPFIGFQSPDGGGGAGRWLRWCPGCSPWLHRDGEAAPAELRKQAVVAGEVDRADRDEARSEEHPSELQSLLRISYAVFCLKKQKAI